MGFFDAIWFGISWFFSLFLGWLLIFAAPFKNLSMLWIIVPIYVNWIFTDFFQERRRTAIGNAITNGAVVLWVSIDWFRTMINSFVSFNLVFLIKSILIAVVLVYGMFIIMEGIRGKDFVTKLGRVRETSYIMLMFTPVIYGVLALNFLNILAMVVFFPLFYFLIEFVNHFILPKLGFIKHEEEAEKKLEGKDEHEEMPGFGGPGLGEEKTPKMPDLKL
ncbi:MAG: hypothetical protein KAT77_01390 [Nanoarchaeota archaeon]|nr:hypothetical protein [Nanoarchaeota archaeon]